MKKFISLILLLSFALVFSGCAAVFKGDSSNIGLNSNPSGALVYANGAEVCSSTPCSVKLKSNQNWNLLFKKNGYKEKTILVSYKIGGLWVVLDIIFGLVPLIVDAATGSWNDLDTPNVNVTLEAQ
jgi:hypothetical protein